MTNLVLSTLSIASQINLQALKKHPPTDINYIIKLLGDIDEFDNKNITLLLYCQTKNFRSNDTIIIATWSDLTKFFFLTN
jgi:hypothetical protein